MDNHGNHDATTVVAAIRAAVEAALPGAAIEVTGGGGHYSLAVVSSAFEGRSMVESHRLVLSAIAPLMSGNDAPVHAVDSLRTRVA